MLDKIVQDIESLEFSARLGVASSTRSFINALEADRSFQELRKTLSETPQAEEVILTRIKALCSNQVDFRYENPHDSALSAYAWALSTSAPTVAPLAVELLTTAPQIW